MGYKGNQYVLLNTVQYPFEIAYINQPCAQVALMANHNQSYITQNFACVDYPSCTSAQIGLAVAHTKSTFATTDTRLVSVYVRAKMAS